MMHPCAPDVPSPPRVAAKALETAMNRKTFHPMTRAARTSLGLAIVPLILPLILVGACQSKDSKAVSTLDAQGDAQSDAVVAPTDASATSDGLPTSLPPLTERGWELRRSVVHIHSAFSHDACDNWITDHPGDVNQDCLAQLRTALCNSGLDVAFMTDHPARMLDHTFEELLFIHKDLGDTPVGPAGAPTANIIHCAATPVLPAHDLMINVGYEGTHDMAIGLHNHFDNKDLEGRSFADADTALPDAVSTVQAIHAVGGISLNAHSEETDISAQRLVDVGVDAMEIYNIHANFLTLMGMTGSGGTPKLGRLLQLEAFLGDPATAPHSDLVLLAMLDIEPEAAFAKFQQVNALRPVTAVVGNDVHQNVKPDKYCAPDGQFAGACDGLKDQYPHLVAALTNGGPIMLSDGKRIDDYTRLLRWVSDVSLIPKQTPVQDRSEAIKTAFLTARNWAVFQLLGDPQGLDFAAWDGAKHAWVEMGGTVPLGSTLYLHFPALQPTPWAPWTLADAQIAGQVPEISANIWRIVPGATDPTLVAEKALTVASNGATVQFKPTLPGRYHVELRIVPKHLRTLMKGLGKLVDTEQRWAVGNPITVK